MNNTPVPQPKYFGILRALHRGGLSLWLNRHTLLPMTLVPTVVTFLTLMIIQLIIRDNDSGMAVGDMVTEGDIQGLSNVSPFLIALIQIPADFVMGMFSALIIFIIMNAPEKNDKDKPVMFTLNVMERKDLLIKAAIAHVVIGYLAAGLFGLMSSIYSVAGAGVEESGQANILYFILTICILLAVFYGVRLLMLPILIIANIDAVSFFKQFKSVDFSIPIAAVKGGTLLSIGIVLLFLSSFFSALGGGVEGPATNIFSGIADFINAFGVVIATAWGYAALAIGLRYMMKGK
jgi:hypothetical protein